MKFVFDSNVINKELFDGAASPDIIGTVNILLYEVVHQENPGEPVSIATITRKHTQLDEDKISVAIDSVDDFHLIEELDHDFNMMVSSQSIHQQYIEYQKRLEVEKRLTKSRQEELSSKNLADVVRDNQAGIRNNSAYGYISHEERTALQFTEWLPTLRFASDGQVFFIRSKEIMSLANEFPQKNISEEIEKIFAYLMRNDKVDMRPSSGKMMAFVRRWLGNKRQTQAADTNYLFNESDIE